MVLVKAKVRLLGRRTGYSTDSVLTDTGVRMSLLDRPLAETLGVQYTGREISFLSISGQTVKASEAVLSELEVEGEVLGYDAVVVAEMPRTVKDTLKENGLGENVVIGLLTLERANMISDTTTGKLGRAKSFIFQSPCS